MLEFWSTGNVRDIEVIAVVCVLTVIQWRFKVVELFRKVRLLYVMTLSLSMGATAAFVLVVFYIDFLVAPIPGGNPIPGLILFRAYSVLVIGSGHWFTWVALFMVYARYGWKDIVAGGIKTAVFGALHELSWYAAYMVSTPTRALEVAYYYSPFIVLLLVSLVVYAVLCKIGTIEPFPAGRLLAAYAFLLAFDSIWVIAGFPISIDNILGPTALYSSVAVNAIEDMGWLVLAAVML